MGVSYFLFMAFESIFIQTIVKFISEAYVVSHSNAEAINFGAKVNYAQPLSPST